MAKSAFGSRLQPEGSLGRGLEMGLSEDGNALLPAQSSGGWLHKVRVTDRELGRDLDL